MHSATPGPSCVDDDRFAPAAACKSAIGAFTQLCAEWASPSRHHRKWHGEDATITPETLHLLYLVSGAQCNLSGARVPSMWSYQLDVNRAGNMSSRHNNSLSIAHDVHGRAMSSGMTVDADDRVVSFDHSRRNMVTQTWRVNLMISSACVWQRACIEYSDDSEQNFSTSAQSPFSTLPLCTRFTACAFQTE